MTHHRTWQLVAALVLATALAACAGRTTFARYPGAATVFDPARSDPKALAIAEQVFATAGGPGHWDQAKQIRWQEQIMRDGAVAMVGEEAWDRWNGRHYGALRLRAGGAVVVMRHLYDDTGTAFVMSPRGIQHTLSGNEATQARATAREGWQFNTAALFMAFLVKDPGTVLKYIGQLKAEPGQPILEDVAITFDPNDKARSGDTYHIIVNQASHVIERLEIVKNGKPDVRLGYALKNWVEVGGLKFPTVLENLGYKGEVIAYKIVSVTPKPDDDLYVPQVM